MKWAGPNVWTTLALTINADGSHDYGLAGAGRFPRHWVYDDTGRLVQKSGVIDFEAWYRTAYGAHSPWGDEHSEALAVAVETALERAQLGPGAVLGERAVLEGGARTSTIRAVTRAKVAVATAADIDTEALAALAAGHHREDR